MSKAQMARELVALGAGKSFETLRKYSADDLAAMLDARQGKGETLATDMARRPNESLKDMGKRWAEEALAELQKMGIGELPF